MVALQMLAAPRKCMAAHPATMLCDSTFLTQGKGLEAFSWTQLFPCFLQCESEMISLKTGGYLMAIWCVGPESHRAEK